MFEKIPKELLWLNQWSYSFSPAELKRPTHYKYEPNGALSASEARQKAGENLLTGFYVTAEDPYVLGDIDHVDNPQDPFAELPIEIAELLQKKETYSEVSPSGHGIRFILQLPKAEDKEVVDGLTFYLRNSNGKDKREVQINFGAPWMTITGNATPFAVDKVAHTTLEELKEIFSIRDVEEEKEKKEERNFDRIPSMTEMAGALLSLKHDQNYRVMRAYEKTFMGKYSHYEFWLKMLMGLHHYATLANKKIECLDLAVEWSSRDTESYKGEEDIAKRWRSFDATQVKDVVTYKTIFKMAYSNTLRWPVPKKQTKDEISKGIPPKPIISEYANFKALLDFYDIQIYRDETNHRKLFIAGDEDILKKFFMSYNITRLFGKYYGPFDQTTLVPTFHYFTQAMGFVGVSNGIISGFVKIVLARARRTLNFLKMYFDTPWEKLPAEYQSQDGNVTHSSFDEAFECLKIDLNSDIPEQEIKLYKTYYKIWLMGFVRNLYFNDQQTTNNCILLLTGKEQIRKTSHFRYIFPEWMKSMVAFTPHGFSTENQVRDVSKIASTSILIVWDEIEQYLTSDTESNFKKIIDNLPQTIIDKYETIERTIRPIAIYGGTSNMREFKLGSEGSRRLFHIPVKFVDTDRMSTLCWHKIINELKHYIERMLKKGEVPWLLSEYELKLQSELHATIRSKNSVDLILEEIWDYGSTKISNDVIKGVSSVQTDKTGRLLTTRQVSDTVERCGYPANSFKRAALVRSLERLCSDYTNSRTRRRTMVSPRGEMFKGIIQQNQYKKWVMPPMNKGVMGSKFKSV